MENSIIQIVKKLEDNGWDSSSIIVQNEIIKLNFWKEMDMKSWMDLCDVIDEEIIFDEDCGTLYSYRISKSKQAL